MAPGNLVSRLLHMPFDMKVVVALFFVAAFAGGRVIASWMSPPVPDAVCYYIQADLPTNGTGVSVKTGRRFVGYYPSMHEALFYIREYNLPLCK